MSTSRAASLKALAVLGKTRSDMLPDVPTVAEAGYPDINVVAWYGLAAPGGTPQPIVDKIVAGVNAALGGPEGAARRSRFRRCSRSNR